MQRRRLGPEFGGDGVGALAPKNFFCRPPKLQNLEGTAGDSLSLGTKCWLSDSVGRCIIMVPYT